MGITVLVERYVIWLPWADRHEQTNQLNRVPASRAVAVRTSDGFPLSIIAGTFLFLSAITLWVFDEFVAPHRVLPHWLSFLGSRGPSAWINSTIAIFGFPVCGIGVRPDSPAPVHALVLAWMWAGLMLAILFTGITLTAAVYQ